MACLEGWEWASPTGIILLVFELTFPKTITGSKDPKRRRRRIESITYLGIDFHKRTSTLCFMNEKGGDIEMVNIHTKNLNKFLANRAGSLNSFCLQ